MKKFKIQKVASSGATFILHNLEPRFKMQVIQNDNFDYDKLNDVYDLFKFRGNVFALVITESEIDLDSVEDFSLIRSIIRRAFSFYRNQVYIEKYIPEKRKEGVFETEKYLLKASEEPNHWLCVDKELKIVVKWKEHLFSETQEARDLEDLNLSVTEIAIAMREMGKWLRENHYNKVF